MNNVYPPSPEVESRIANSLNKVTDRAFGIKERVLSLSTKLEPILTPDPNCKKVAEVDACLEPVCSQIVNRINHIQDIQDDIIAYLDNIFNRLEV